jgi:hypothetical protein
VQVEVAGERVEQQQQQSDGGTGIQLQLEFSLLPRLVVPGWRRDHQQGKKEL